MSETLSQIQEIEVKELSEEQIKRLVSEILSNPHKYETEAKFLLKLKTDFRKGGCGYVYLYSYSYKVLYGDIDEVILHRDEFDCDVSEEVLVIPKTVPVVLLYTYHDDDPNVRDYCKVLVFTGSEWKSIEFNIPK
jgi:hypothetical protein